MSDQQKQIEKTYDFDPANPFDGLGDQEFSEKHWQILEAAVRVFSEKGFSASRTSEVAKEAGVSEGTIFNYFKTKKHLLLGLLIPIFVRFFRPLVISGIEKIFRSREGREIENVMFDLMQDRVHLVQNNLPLIKTFAAEAAFHPELLDPIREKVAPKVLEIAKQFFQDEIDKGVFRDLDSLTMLRTSMSMVGGYVLMRNVLPDEIDWQDEEVELRRMIDILMNGLKAKGEHQGEKVEIP